MYNKVAPNFLIIEDHLIVAIGVEKLLKENFNGCTVDSARNSKEAIKLVSKNKYSMVVLDIRMEDNDSTSLLTTLLIKQPLLKTLIFSQNPEDLFAKAFLQKGAKGYLSKQSPPHDLIEAVNVILSGGIYISRSLNQKFSQEIIFNKPQNPLQQLSQREVEVMTLLVEGHSSGDICRMLNLHTSTVGTYKSKIFEKLNVENIIQLKEVVSLYSPDSF